MKNILYYECFSGISGDMNLAAMLDLGISSTHLISELKKLNLAGYEIKITRESQNGIYGTQVDVITEKAHHHRHLSDINRIINESSLDEETKDLSKKIFLKVAEAESKVHQMPLEMVHFHEVGAIDSIIDIVGAAICFRKLNVAKVVSSPLELGSGTVDTAHGKLPVPAPATNEILRGIPVHIGGTDFESTTPTGAAIIATLVNDFVNEGHFIIKKTGYGVGHKKSTTPNLLRVHICEAAAEEKRGNEDAFLVECNLDDMNPEWYDLVMEKLFQAGAQDVYLTSIFMKKNRPGLKIAVLCQAETLSIVKHILLTETTTLGIRIIPVQKSTLERKSKTFHTRYGNVRIKTAWLNGNLVQRKPEYEDCKLISLKENIPLREVMNEIERALRDTQDNEESLI